MSNDASYVQARVDPDRKERVGKKLDVMGLNQSSVIQMLYAYVDTHDELPFRPRIPNEQTQDAIEDARSGDVEEHGSLDDMHKTIEHDG